MAATKKPKNLKMNFNFSDDSDDDGNSSSSNVQLQQVLKELKTTELNNTEGTAKYLQSAYDNTIIISSDRFNTSELPSFSEDFGLPVTESTCLDDFGSDPTLYVTALGDEITESKSHEKTIVVNKCHGISGQQAVHKHISKQSQNWTEDKENIHLTNSKRDMIPLASVLSHKISTNQDNYLRWSSISETPLKGNKVSVKHRLYENKFPTPLKTKHCEKNVDNIGLFQDEDSSVSIQHDDGKSTNEQSSQILTDSFVEVQDVSVQTSFVTDGTASATTGSAICERQNNLPDDLNIVKSEASLDSPGQVVYSSECQESLEYSNTSAITDGNEDGTLASSYEVQDVSVQTSLIESLIPDIGPVSPHMKDTSFPDSKPLSDNTEDTSVAHENIEQNLQYMEKSFIEMKIQDNQKDLINRKTVLINNDNKTKKYTDRGSTHKVDALVRHYHEMESKSQGKNCSIDMCTRIENDKLSKDNDLFREDAFSEKCVENHRDRYFDISVRKTRISVSKENRNTHRGSSSNTSDSDESSDGVVAASDSENKTNLSSRGTRYITDNHDNDVANIDFHDHNEMIEESRGAECSIDNVDDDGSFDKNNEHRNICTDNAERAIPNGKRNISITEYKHRDNKYGVKDSPVNGKAAKRIMETKSSPVENDQDHNGAKSMSQRKVTESSDDDSDFENFLNKVKSSTKRNQPVQPEMPMNEFIVDDGEITDDSSKTDEDDDDDDEVFYIKTSNKLNEVKNKRLPHIFQDRCYTYYNTDSSCSDTAESDSDLDDFIVETCPKNKNSKKKSTPPAFDLSSSDESLLSTIPSKSEIQVTSKRQDGQMNYSDENLNKGKSKVSRKPESGTIFPPRISDQEVSTECESFDTKQNTQFKLPKCVEQWRQHSETPARLDMKTDNFKTPRNLKGFDLHPMTAPRSTFGSLGIDDNIHFLKSLDVNMADYKRHADVFRFIKRFKETKVELTQKIFHIFNSAVFEDKLPKDFQIEWNSRYTKTAGTFHYKGTQTSFSTKIVLSVKICDSPERVRDTLAHELCHAAVKLINNVSEGHGVFWKSWARKVNRTFPFMPVIARCHSYHISTKYTYQCVDCKYRIGRHSKSLDTDRKICGHCHGKFQLYLTKELDSDSSNGQSPVTPKTPRTPNKFALFVKEYYSEVKKREDGLRHSDVMKILSQEFAEKNKISDIMS